jgi:hypothetical protein
MFPPNPDVEWEHEFRVEFEIVEGDAGLRPLAGGPDPEQLARHIAIEHMTGPAGSGGANMMMRFDDLPVPIAFDASWRRGEQEWWIGSITLAPAEGRRMRSFGQWIEDFHAERVDVILRSSRAAAERDPEMDEYWEGELVFPDLPVPYFSPPTPAGVGGGEGP